MLKGKPQPKNHPVYVNLTALLGIYYYDFQK